jgi:hypothetical protein
VTNYDPEIAPDPTAWLTLDEQERMHIVETYHRTAGIGLPNVKVHAAFHAMVENQLAEGLECVVRAMARLTSEGLSRHDALHAIGSVVAELQFDAAELKTQDDANTIQSRYNAAVERLSAKEWRRRYGA